MKRNILRAIIVVAACLALTSCKKANVTESYTFEWEDDPVVGKVKAGYYKCTSIVKDGETYEEIKELRDIADRSYLVVNDDGTAVFESEGKKTAYTYDKNSFYLSEDATRSNGIPYVYIGGRLVINDGLTVRQYEKLTDEENEGNYQ